MLRVFDHNGREVVLAADEAFPADANIAWFDLDTPTQAEELAVEAAIGTSIPSRDELRDIEPSSRLYTENGALYLTASIPYKTDTPVPELTDVGFIIAKGTLVTIRYAEPHAFRLFSASLGKQEDCAGGYDILTRLIETIVDRNAEILENISRTADGLSARVFMTSNASRPERVTRDLEATLVEIAGIQRLLAKTRESLMSMSRVASFLQGQSTIRDDPKLDERSQSTTRDILSLAQHADFISGNVIFLLDASLGLISVQQNQIIKIFSIAAVVLLPPTFIASIYGMNFQSMPELDWQYGYPMALTAMVAAALVPYLWFRRKGWM